MGSWKVWARSGKGLDIRTLSGVVRESQQRPGMQAPSELLHSALAVCGLGLGSGMARAAVGGIS